uniref:Uncharacterized protein n=1 Tax=Opuntia streptacantha TaxID=393608 RepID=A0A7C8YRA7_OPUST
MKFALQFNMTQYHTHTNQRTIKGFTICSTTCASTKTAEANQFCSQSIAVQSRLNLVLLCPDEEKTHFYFCMELVWGCYNSLMQITLPSHDVPPAEPVKP